MLEFNVPSDGSTLQALTTAYKTQLAVLAQTATLRRGKVLEMAIGPFDNPGSTDCNIAFVVMKQDAADGTPGGTPVPAFALPMEAGTLPAAGSLWKDNYTAEPTMLAATGPMWGPQLLNQHSGFRWYAPSEIGIPWAAVNNKGLAFRAKGATSTITGFTATVVWSVRFAE